MWHEWLFKGFVMGFYAPKPQETNYHWRYRNANNKTSVFIVVFDTVTMRDLRLESMLDITAPENINV